MKNPFAKKSALVVDDFAEFRLSMKRLLEELGFPDVHTARDGEDAIQQYRQNHPDLILCDHNLGEGKNGQQILEELHFRNLFHYESAFILTTAERQMATVMGTLEYKPDDYIAKPFNKAMLNQRITRILLAKQQMLPVYREMNHKRWQQASKKLLAFMAQAPRLKPLCQQLLATCYMQQKNYRDAEQLYKTVLEDRKVGWAQLGLARCLFESSDLVQAERCLKELLAINSRAVEAYDLLSAIARQQNDLPQAMDYLKQAINLSPYSVSRQRQLAELAHQTQETDIELKARRQAFSYGKNSIQQQPEDGMKLAASLLNVDAQDDQGKQRRRLRAECDKVLKDTMSTTRNHPRSAIMHQLLSSQLLSAQGHADEARNKLAAMTEQMQEVIALQDPELLHMIRQSYTKAEDNEGIARLEQQLAEVKRSNDSTDPSNRAGIQYYQQGQYEQAINAFEQALDKQPFSTNIRLNLLQALIKWGSITTSAATEERIDKLLTQLSIMPAGHTQYDKLMQLQQSYNDLKRMKQQ